MSLFVIIWAVSLVTGHILNREMRRSMLFRYIQEPKWKQWDRIRNNAFIYINTVNALIAEINTAIASGGSFMALETEVTPEIFEDALKFVNYDGLEYRTRVVDGLVVNVCFYDPNNEVEIDGTE